MLDPLTRLEPFVMHFGSAPDSAYFSPGRVNLIGEHIDYNGGFVLPAAISLGITALVRRRDDDSVRVHSANFGETVSLERVNDAPLLPRYEGWALYVAATLQVLKDKGLTLRGADVYLDSDLPLGSGLSSSAALECLIAYIFNREHYDADRLALALDAQRAERQYVGVQCGIMDQFAVANGKKGFAMLLNCDTLEYDYVPADFGDYDLVIINSNQPRTLADSKYNERRAECDKALAILRQFDPAEHLSQVHPVSLAHLADDTLYRRAKHAVTENSRVLQAVQALDQGKTDLFGLLLTESHQSLDDNYEVSGEALNTIVHYATHFDDCAGARMTGAGFGGCCIALVKRDRVERFKSYVVLKYEQKTGRKADIYLCETADGVKQIKSWTT